MSDSSSTHDSVRDYFTQAAKEWPPVIARVKVPVFTGGTISSKYMENLDCLGEGPKGGFMKFIFRIICLIVIEFIKELIQ